MSVSGIFPILFSERRIIYRETDPSCVSLLLSGSRISIFFWNRKQILEDRKRDESDDEPFAADASINIQIWQESVCPFLSSISVAADDRSRIVSGAAGAASAASTTGS